MTCEEIRLKLDQFVSGELPDTERREIADHLAGCEVCRSEAAALQEWKRLIRSGCTRFLPSPQFRKRLEEQYASDRALRRTWFPRPVAALAACSVLGVGMLFAADYRGALARRQIFGEIADQHAAILATESSLDVSSAQDDEVESWFQEKLPFPLRLPDLKDTPFRLVGARMAFLDQSPGAQLIFLVRGRQVSAFIFQRNARLRRVSHDHDLVARHASFNMEICGYKQLRFLIVGDTDLQNIHQLADLLEAAESR